MYQLNVIYILQSTNSAQMEGKRQAPYNINQKTLEPIEKDNQQAPSKTNQAKQEPRVFHKIKKHTEEPKQEQVHKEQQTNLAKQAKQAKKDQRKSQNELPPTNIFKNQNGIGLFSQKNDLKAENSAIQAPKVNLSSASLFTGNGYSLPKPTVQFGPTNQNIFSQPLFIKQPNPSFFAGNGHSNPKPISGGSLFSGIKIQGGSSMFSNGDHEKKSSIFGFSSGISLPPVRGGPQDEENQGDSAQLQKDQQMKIDRSKSKGNYQYKSQVKILVSGIVKKFKKNNGDLIQNVEALVEQDQKTGLTMLVIRLIATKNTIFSGLIVKGKSDVRIINKKEQNIEVTTLSLPKQKNKVAEKDKIKLQLQSGELGKQFFLKIEQAINKQTKKDNNEKQQDNNEKA